MRMHVENGEVVGYLPEAPNLQYRVPLRECIEEAGYDPDDDDLADEISADDVSGAVELVGAVETGRSRRRRRQARRKRFRRLLRKGGRAFARFHGVPTKRLRISGDDDDLETADDDDDDDLVFEAVGSTIVGRSRRSRRKARRKKRRAAIRRGLKRVTKKAARAVKKVAKSKIVRGLAKVVAKVVPSPFNAPILAAQGAAKLARAVKKGIPKARKIVKHVRAAAEGKITPKALTAVAKRLNVAPKIAAEAATIKRLAMDAAKDPRAAAAFRLASDVVSDDKAKQSLALAAAAQSQLEGDGRAYVVQAPTGEVYRTIVQASTSP